ncbi:hypothetical protein THIOM_002511 [Candidatus Thiomargarita nelsonii]|uniref:Uncharacterized protein n=1 Tax=Candidatus Thiomargarita nelsonii TaxID=1003181 RepID=A0A176S1A0_9GAMM|nr:hypothetical protein THIOM_002511 [Candidatus Thiomargarita nelsonii]
MSNDWLENVAGKFATFYLAHQAFYLAHRASHGAEKKKISHLRHSSSAVVADHG